MTLPGGVPDDDTVAASDSPIAVSDAGIRIGTHDAPALVIGNHAPRAVRSADVTGPAAVPEPPVTDTNRFRTAFTSLKRMQKSPRGASLYTLRVNRPSGRVLAAGFSMIGVSPNVVTTLSGAASFSAIGILVACRPTLWIGVTVGLLLVLGFALDSADGQLARLRRAGSSKGEWYDHMLDCATKIALHCAVLIAWYRLGRRGPILLLPLAFLLVAVLAFFGGILVGKLREQSNVPAVGHRSPAWLRATLMTPVDYGLVCCSFLFWGYLGPFTAIYFTLAIAHTMYLATFSVVWYRELL